MSELSHPNNRKSLRSQSLDLLRFPLAVIVAAIHVSATRSYWDNGHLVRFSDMAGAKWFYGFLDAFLRNQSVPIYFFIAGYVFFLGVNLTIEIYGQKLKNRSHSLLVPYISWNIMAVLIALPAFLPEFRSVLPNLDNIKMLWSIPSILETFWNSWYGIFSTGSPMPPGGDIYPQDYPLWFVRDLMIIAISAPLIFFCLKKTRWYTVVLLGAMWLLFAPFKLGHFSQLLTGYFFFTWGAYLSYHGRDMIFEFRKHFRICLELYFLLSIVLWCFSDMPLWLFKYLKCLNVVAGMVMAYGLAARLIESRRVKISRFLAASSFFVYAGHGIVVAYINLALFELFRPKDFLSVAFIYAATLLISVIGLVLIFKWLGQHFPHLQKILAGRVYKQS